MQQAAFGLLFTFELKVAPEPRDFWGSARRALATPEVAFFFITVSYLMH